MKQNVVDNRYDIYISDSSNRTRDKKQRDKKKNKENTNCCIRKKKERLSATIEINYPNLAN